MKVFTDQNFTDTYTLNRSNRIAVPNSLPQMRPRNQIMMGGYKKIRSLTLGSNESVGIVSNELYGNKCAAKIEFVYSDGTEQNSTEKFIRRAHGNFGIQILILKSW